MKINFKSIIPHIIIVLLFLGASLAYFYPVLQGKKILQSDIAQYIGMAKEQNDFRAANDAEPYWTNSAFGGMPTYQLGANYPHNYIKQIDRAIRFLPRPADYLFLYFIGFYVLLLVLKVDYKLAFIGSLAFGFSTYFIIIIGVGHNAKAHAIGYFPLVLAGILMVFQKRYIWGFLLTTFAMALEIVANHVQMTYYLMLLVAILGVINLIEAIKTKEFTHYFKAIGILLVAVVLGVVVNATSLLATKEYANWSTRGKSELTINPDGSAKAITSGLDKEYITQYSYGIFESLDLFVPRLLGGASSENLGKDSKAYEFLIQQGVSRTQALNFASNIPTYWGDQISVAAPAYIGAVLLFLFILGLFLVNDKLKWWMLSGSILFLLLSWGKNFSALTNFMIDYFPMYNKFRAVSSMQVIIELCVPILGIYTLAKFFDKEIDKIKKIKALKITALITVGLCVVLFLMKGSFDFEGVNDGYYSQVFGPELLEMIRLDRGAIYTSDVIRTLIYVLLTAALLWLWLKGAIKKNIAIVGLGLLFVFDLVGVDQRYVNEEGFVRARQIERPFPITAVDQQILKDTSYYRVFEPSIGLNGSRTSFYHKALSGYHGAKPGRFQELYDFHIQNPNVRVLNMLNVKYVIQESEDGKKYPAKNPFANGNAWFISDVKRVDTANEEIKALDELDTGTTIVVNKADYKDNAETFKVDSLASITLTSYKPNHLVYKSINANKGIAVFSEMYYKNGWNAYLDGELAPHFKANYVLRAMEVPAGKHNIVFKFQPKVVATGSMITLSASVVFLLLLFAALWYEFKKKPAVVKPEV